MDVNRKELSDIKGVLKESPRGMTVTEISKAVDMNRHSVAKYLEVLVAAGHVDMKTFGPSKVYYLSQRVPLSAMLSFSSDAIVIIDRDLLIRNANDKFLETMNMDRESVINRNIENFMKPMPMADLIMGHLRESLDGKELTLDTSFSRGNMDYFYTVKFIPTVFDAGEKGVTLIMIDVSEQRRVENAIRDSERKFRDLIGQSTDGITLCDEGGVVIEYNESMSRLTNIPRERVIGRYVWELEFFIRAYGQLPERPMTELKEFTLNYLKTGRSPLKNRLNVIDIHMPDGAQITVQANIFPIRSDRGNMLAAIVRDVTEMRKAERALQESEEKFRSVIEQSLDGIVVAGQDGRIIEFNKGLERITGFTKEQAMGRSAWELFNRAVGVSGHGAPGTIEELKDYILPGAGEKIDGHRLFEIEVHPGPEKRVLQGRTFRIKRPNDVLICAIVRDITEQKKAEILLKESEEKFRNLAETTSSGILIVQDNRIIYANRGAYNIIGYSAEEFRSIRMQDFVHPDHIGMIQGSRQDYMNKSVMPSGAMEIRILTKDKKERWIEMSFGTMTMNGRAALIKTFFDITDRKDMEEALKKERAELENRVKERTAELVQVNDALKVEVEQRKRSEETARKSREKYRNLVENIAEVVWQKDVQGRYTYISPRLRDLMGYEPAEFLGRTLLDFMPPEDARRIEAEYWRLFREPGQYDLKELRMRHKDGHDLVIESGGVPFFDKGGKFQGYRGLWRDVTDKKRAEEKLLKTTSELMAIFSAFPDMIFEMGTDGTIKDFYTSRSEYLYVQPEAFLGKKMHEVLPSGACRIIEEAIDKVSSTNTMGVAEYVLPVNGKDETFEARLVPAVGDRIIMIVRPITAQRQAEEALRKSERKYRGLLENINDIAWETNKDGRITYIGPQVRDILGYEPEYVRNKSVMEFMPEEDRQTYLRRHARAYQSPASYNLSVSRVYHKDGSIHEIELNGSPKYDETGRFVGYIGVIRDITERKRMEETLEMMKISIDHFGDAVYWVGSDGRFDYVNDAACRMLGYTKEELQSMEVEDIDPTAKTENVDKAFAALREKGHDKLETIHVTKDGRRIPVEIALNYVEFNGKAYSFCFVKQRPAR